MQRSADHVLLTAFDAYDTWQSNASWAALVDLTRWYDGPARLTTRRYPVDLMAAGSRLRTDLSGGYDLAIHLGQAPGSARLRIERFGLNVLTDGSPIVSGGPAAYQSVGPVEAMVAAATAAGIPAALSHHAGTHLCNALLYLSRHYCETGSIATPSLFLHVPLTPAQVASRDADLPSMSPSMVSAAIALMIDSAWA